MQVLIRKYNDISIYKPAGALSSSFFFSFLKKKIYFSTIIAQIPIWGPTHLCLLSSIQEPQTVCEKATNMPMVDLFVPSYTPGTGTQELQDSTVTGYAVE